MKTKQVKAVDVREGDIIDDERFAYTMRVGHIAVGPKWVSFRSYHPEAHVRPNAPLKVRLTEDVSIRDWSKNAPLRNGLNPLTGLFVNLHLWLLDAVGRYGMLKAKGAWINPYSEHHRTLVVPTWSSIPALNIPLRSVEIADGLTSWEINL